MTIIERALKVPNDSRIGLGSGRAAQSFVRALADGVRSGALQVRGLALRPPAGDLAGAVALFGWLNERDG